MPVSRKRKKPSSSRASARAARRRSAEQVRAARRFRDVYTAWEQDSARRIELAGPAARDLVAGLIPARITEDDLCARLGPLLTELSERMGDKHVGPDHFAEAMIGASVAAVREALEDGHDPAGPWHVLTVLAGILPDFLRVKADDAAAGLRLTAGDAAEPRAGGPAGPRAKTGDAAGPRAKAGDAAAEVRRIPGGGELPEGPLVAGEVRWTRDRYGSRFAVIAPFSQPDGPARCYLWDIDACGPYPVTVHSGYYASPEEALAAWQVGAGTVAAGGTAWQQVDDSLLLEELLPTPEVILAIGGESAAQHAEYHRGRRLAEVLLALPAAQRGGRPAEADPPAAAERFLEWRGEHATDPEDLGELVATLAELWPSEIDMLYETCSPHRVAHVAGQAREDFEPDFAAGVIALLPEWVTWLVGRTGIASELVERSLAYAQSHTQPQPGNQARITE